MNYGNENNGMNNDVNNKPSPYVYNSYKVKTYTTSNNVSSEEMSEERKLYLLEKEKKINKRNKTRKIVSLVVLFLVISIGGFYLYKYYFRPVKIDERIDKNSIHYATDLYYSDGSYYEKYLDEKEKKLYLDFFNDLKDLEPVTKIDCRNYGYDSGMACTGNINNIITTVLVEHPDLFWYRSSTFDSASQDGSEFVIRHSYVSANRIRLYFVERRLLRKIDELASEFEKLDTDYEKVKAVYDWLGKNKSYSELITRKDGTAWSALLDDDTVCAGYAAASQLLFQRLGIESILVSGETGGPHAWNFVKLDDGYYWYDATVGGSRGGDSSGFYDGFLFSDTSNYSVHSVDIEEYKFGTKYLEG